MTFLIDAQLPPGLATWIREMSKPAVHVSDVGLLSASDIVIADYAQQTGATLLSKDADFAVLRRPDRFAFVWLRCGNASNQALRSWLEPRWDQIVALLATGERLIEVR